MSLYRKAARRDFNEAAIVGALEAIGVTVYRVSGAGVPDLLTHARGVWLPIEVKRPRGKLTKAQRDTRAITPYPVVETVAQALALFGVVDRGAEHGVAIREV